MTDHDLIASRPPPNQHASLPVSRVWAWLTCVIVVLPIVYVLSLGPAIYVLPASVIRPLYGPLINFELHCPALDRFLTWYMEKVWKCGKW
jgi:hypothetical protein